MGWRSRARIILSGPLVVKREMRREKGTVFSETGLETMIPERHTSR